MGGDGDWFWYAKLLRGGTLLYKDLDFTQQPLFVLETAWFQTLLGESWIASKVPAVLHLVALLTGMLLIARQSKWSDRQKAIILVCAFFFGIRPEWYRFDDYHVVADFLIAFSAIAVLRLERDHRNVWIVVALGLMAGLTITTRLNDGAALFCFSALAIAYLGAGLRTLQLTIYAASFVATVLSVVAFTRESLVSWGVTSVLRAGALKGGNAQFLSDPGHVLVTAWAYLWSPELLVVVATLAFALSWALLTAPSKRRTTSTYGITACGLIVAGSLFYLRDEIISGTLLYAFLALLTFCVYGVAAYTAVKLVLHLTIKPYWLKWKPRELLLFLPFLMVLSTSLSSGGNFYDLYMPIAMLILLFPVVRPITNSPYAVRTLTACAAILAVSGIFYKTADPTSWISYRTSPIFINREVINHPSYGPMIMDKTLLRFVSQTCSIIDGDSKVELLSIPFPYANYYCNVPPWHDFVQTWFDTANKAVIDDMISQLQLSPPKWILYQRQVGTLTYHEITYNGGQALPERALDDYIMAKIAGGEWRVVRRELYGVDSDWILMRTSTNVSEGQNLVDNSTGERGLTGWHVQGYAPSWSASRQGGGTIIATNAGGDFADSVLLHSVSFRRTELTTVALDVESSDVNTYVGGFGYSADLFDATSQSLVGSLGQSNANIPLRRYSFSAMVTPDHQYQLRLHLSATDGRVAFSNVDVGGSDLELKASGSSEIPIRTDSLSGWSSSISNPEWSSEVDKGEHDSRFLVRQAGVVPVKSTLTQNMRFGRSASVVVQARIGAGELDPSGRVGYDVELYDEATGAVAGSLGIPAKVGPPNTYSFTARVEAGKTYGLRLIFDAASGEVEFSRLKVEYGTTPTDWSGSLSPKSRPRTSMESNVFKLPSSRSGDDARLHRLNRYGDQRLVETVGLRNHIMWPLAHLLKNHPDVFAHNPKEEENQSHRAEHDSDYRTETIERHPKSKPADRENRQQDKREGGDRQPENRNHLEGRNRAREYAVDRKIDIPKQLISRLPTKAWRAYE
jgi:hypothetical protein